MTTQNTSDAISSLKHLRSMSPSIILCIIIWVLSPLGGQSSLRILSTKKLYSTAQTTARYADTGPLGQGRLADNLYDIDFQLKAGHLSDSLMLMALNQPADVYNTPTDVWGNAKIPRVELLDPEESGRWIDTVHINNPDSFTSLIGIPLHDIPASGSSSLLLETSYLTTNCSHLSAADLSHLNATDVSQPLIDQSPAIVFTCSDCHDWSSKKAYDICNTSSPPPSCARLQAFLGLEEGNKQVAAGINRINVQLWNPCPTSPDINRNRNKGNLWLATCAVADKRVEVRLMCENRSCYSTSIRLSRSDRRSINLTPFDYWAAHTLTNRSLLHFRPVEILRYLSNSTKTLSLVNSGDDIRLSDMDNEEFSLRIGIILNTYIQSYLTQQFFRPKTSVYKIFGPEHSPSGGLRLLSQSTKLKQIHSQLRETSNDDYWGFSYAATNVTTTYSVDVYHPIICWVVVLLLCSATLLCVGTFGIVCESRSLAPGMFDPVLSHTCNNITFGIEPGGSTLDVEDRLRILGHMEVRVGDIHHVSDVGYIGLAVKEKVMPMRKGRLYE